MIVEALIRRDRVVTGAGLILVTALSWIYIAREPMSAHLQGTQAAPFGAPRLATRHDLAANASVVDEDPDRPS